jgi:hypothetical protein
MSCGGVYRTLLGFDLAQFRALAPYPDLASLLLSPRVVRQGQALGLQDTKPVDARVIWARIFCFLPPGLSPHPLPG